MTVLIRPYDESLDSQWDEFCAKSSNATFLHTRRFLGYHGNRFTDKSAVLMESGSLVGVFPAAESPLERNTVISHPGITFGGIVHQGWLKGARMMEAFAALSEYYRRAGYRQLLYKVVPQMYMSVPSQDDVYVLFRTGAEKICCDLACAIDLFNRRELTQRRRRGLSKARKSVTVSDDPALIQDLWVVLEGNLLKHGKTPVHSVDEMELLRKRFPENIKIRCALIGGEVVAGVVLFNSAMVWHAQYIAANMTGYATSALDAVFDSTIHEALIAGARYYDFGISTEQEGKLLNEGLCQYKSEFGGSGVVYEWYRTALENDMKQEG